MAVDVAIALVWREGRLLITRRRAGTHLAGFWEFPGGKCQPGEDPAACAEREVLEEVGIRCVARRGPGAARPALEYAYPERTVRIHPVECDYRSGEPQTLGVEAWAWVTPAELERFAFPPANAPLLEALRAAAASELPE